MKTQMASTPARSVVKQCQRRREGPAARGQATPDGGPFMVFDPFEPFAKPSFRPNSALCSKFYPRNIMYMPAVKFFACLDFERKSKFCK
ncbi:MAG: hypothetical protein V2J11_06195, partial [Desulfofustis sp.]|nr:hypothetical protein [Desulfofustis sp.]